MIQLKAYKLNFKLEEPLSISFHTFYYTESVIINLIHDGKIGIGEAAPFKPITGDSQEEVIEQAKLLTEIPLDPTKDSLQTLHDFMDKKGIVSETLRAGVDFAYHDLIAKIQGIPVYKLYATTPRPVDNSITIMIQPTAEETAQHAAKIFAKYPDLKILKLKLQGDQSDIERVTAVKKIAPKNMTFLLDANQGFKNPEEDIKTVNKLVEILENVVLIEQPTPKDDLEKLKYMKEHVKNTLIFADESATTLEAAKAVIAAKAAHGINIKLQKAGGIWPAKQIAKLCEENDLKIMEGCMLEGPIGIGAGIHFAVSTHLILSDLDADLYTKPYTNTVLPFIKGQRTILEIPGIGVTLDAEKIKKLQETGELIYEKVI